MVPLLIYNTLELVYTLFFHRPTFNFIIKLPFTKVPFSLDFGDHRKTSEKIRAFSLVFSITTNKSDKK
jgi:hypothetical protein